MSETSVSSRSTRQTLMVSSCATTRALSIIAGIIPSTSMAGSHYVGTVNVKRIDVLRCNQSMAMQADGTCSMNCLTTKCLFCQTIDKLFYHICRYCDGVSSSCQPISRCPTDYYLENGICYKCPIGCSTCERGDLCTSCDSGLVNIWSD
jgi:hypothetical protein